jgi:hypothetical protein
LVSEENKGLFPLRGPGFDIGLDFQIRKDGDGTDGIHGWIEIRRYILEAGRLA